MGGLSGLYDTVTSPVAVLSCALVLAGLFGWAGMVKLRHPYAAAVAAVHFRVLTRPRRQFGRAVGAWELVVSAGLLLSPTRAVAAVLAAATSLAFAVAIASALRRGERFECACLGSGDETIGTAGLARALLMACAAALVSAHAGLPAASDIPEAVVVAAVVFATPLLLVTHRRIRAHAKLLDERLDWEWIMQEHTARSASR
jgi:hypothetical protein